MCMTCGCVSSGPQIGNDGSGATLQSHEFALNLVSTPGSGKTSMLVRTVSALEGTLPVAVIEGDQQTANDAERVRAAGVPAVQINTGNGCHLDAHMVGHALDRLPQDAGGLLLIENVGKLVCPAAFDLDFDVDKPLASARRVNPSIEILCTPARTGKGSEQWLDWICTGCAGAQAAAAAKHDGARVAS